MPARLFLSSGDLMADRRFEFARDLQLKGDLPAAADLLLQAIELAPGFVTAWFTLGEIREELGEGDAAIAAFRGPVVERGVVRTIRLTRGTDIDAACGQLAAKAAAA